jgi:hypothetical protein
MKGLKYGIVCSLAIALMATQSFARAKIMACSDEIEKMKKEEDAKGGPGDEPCRDVKFENGKFVVSEKRKAVFMSDSKWECKEDPNLPCLDKSSLKMVSCVREFQCIDK